MKDEMKSDISLALRRIHARALGGEFSPALEDTIVQCYPITRAAAHDIAAVAPSQYALVLGWVANHEDECPTCARPGHPWSCAREALLPKTKAYEEYVGERYGQQAAQAYRELMRALMEADEPPDLKPPQPF